jgi:hypothetical protein
MPNFLLWKLCDCKWFSKEFQWTTPNASHKTFLIKYSRNLVILWQTIIQKTFVILNQLVLEKTSYGMNPLKFSSNIQNLVHLHLRLPKKNIYTHNLTINENILHFPIFYMLDKVNVNSKKIGKCKSFTFLYTIFIFVFTLTFPKLVNNPKAENQQNILFISNTSWFNITKVFCINVCHNTTKCHQKRRELEKEKWRNADTTSQGTHTDPNRIRAAWSSNLHQAPL